MQFTIPAGALLDALRIASAVTPSKSEVIVLRHVRIAAAAGALTISGSDLDIFETVTVEDGVTVAADGEAIAPPGPIEAVLKTIERGEIVTVTSEPARLTLRAGRARANVHTLDPRDWPDLKRDDEAVAFEVPGAVLAAMLGRTVPFVSTEEARHYLKGVLLHASRRGGVPSLAAFATDGTRGAYEAAALPAGAAGMPSVIVPADTVKRLIDLAGAAKGVSVHVEVSERRIAASAGGHRILSKLIDGTYPDYGRVIPQGNDRRAAIDAAALARAVDAATAVRSERGNAVKLAWAAGSVTASVSNPDIGEASATAEADHDGINGDGSTYEIGVNARYLRAALDVTGPGIVEFAFGDPGSPILMWPKGSGIDGPRFHLIMPMRV